jgi:TetR/AcrR family transcriptional repressor of nem operon
MRVTAETHRSHGAAILRAASALFRARGLAAVSVADVTHAAGLTHGAFYGHFDSKAGLAGAACRAVFEASAASWRARASAARDAGGDGLDAIIDAYLTERHRDDAAHGCAIATLGPEMARGDAGLHGALSDGTGALLAVLEEEIASRHPQADAPSRAAAALAVLSSMAGGILVARALTDPDRSRAALAAASAAARAAANLT